MGLPGIQLKTISHDMLQVPISKHECEITHSILLSHLPGGNKSMLSLDFFTADNELPSQVLVCDFKHTKAHCFIDTSINHHTKPNWIPCKQSLTLPQETMSQPKTCMVWEVRFVRSWSCLRLCSWLVFIRCWCVVSVLVTNGNRFYKSMTKLNFVFGNHFYIREASLQTLIIFNHSMDK